MTLMLRFRGDDFTSGLVAAEGSRIAAVAYINREAPAHNNAVSSRGLLPGLTPCFVAELLQHKLNGRSQSLSSFAVPQPLCPPPLSNELSLCWRRISTARANGLPSLLTSASAAAIARGEEVPSLRQHTYLCA